MHHPAAIHRPLALRLRPDLLVTAIEMAGATTWIVKDPVTLEHFQFSPEEHALIDRLRQPASIADLQRAFAAQLPPQTISTEAVWDFLRRLHSAGLLMSEAPGQAGELVARMRRERRQRWALAWTQLLAIRFRGFDPDRLLTAIHDRCRWIFSPLVVLLAVCIVLYAGSLVVGHFGEFANRLPELWALGDPRNVLWLLLAIGGVKVLHELGHAFVCKHYGGEVHELGFMLLAFSPCLYCDVTDAWRFPSKWRRIAVSAAGMAVELVLAALATIVWWHSQAGIVNLVAMNVMVVCTVGTLLANGNPLLRFDGYYILSDLIEVPNLWQRSRDVLKKLSMDWLARKPTADDPLLPARQRLWLAAYAVASKTYVALVCAMIVWGLVVLLYPLRLQNLAYAVGLTVLASALVGPVMGAVRFARNPIRHAEFRAGRAAMVATMALVVAVLVFAMPVNYYVHAPLVILPADAARVYATIDGTLSTTLPAGQRVEQHQRIAQLTNPEVELELARLEGERKLQALRLEHLQRLRSVDPATNSEIPAARAALADLDRRLQDRRDDAARLVLTAPAEGTIISPPRIAPAESSGRLPGWSGSVLDAVNRGARVEPGTLVCLVGDPNSLMAVLLVSDADVKRLVPGQPVRMRIDQLPGNVIAGEVVEVARHEARDERSEAASRADLTPLLAGIVRPGQAQARYQVHVRLAESQSHLVIGGRGAAKVAAERITLARWLMRFVGQTFRLPM